MTKEDHGFMVQETPRTEDRLTPEQLTYFESKRYEIDLLTPELTPEQLTYFKSKRCGIDLLFEKDIGSES